MEESFDIMLDDLKPEIQEQLLEFLGIKDASEGNFDVFPVALVTKSDVEMGEDD